MDALELWKMGMLMFEAWVSVGSGDGAAPFETQVFFEEETCLAT